MCSVDDPKHCQINVYFDPRRPPKPQKFTESMRAEVNVLKQELMPLKPLPQYDVVPQRSAARSPPQQPCYVYRVVTVTKTTVKTSVEKEILLDVRNYKEGESEGRMKPERIALESSSPGTDPEEPR